MSMSDITFGDLPSEAVQVAVGRAWPSPGDWERHSGRIKQLYVEEDMPLKDVIAVMAKDYGHIATPKMYKTRITKWGLDKNRKEADMTFILQRQTQRDAIGKDTSFRVRDRVVKIEEVQRYFKRKRRIPDRSSSGTPPSTPPHIAYRTPSPLCSPNPLGANSLVISPNSRIAGSPSLPQVFLVPEHLLFSVKSYIDGSFGNKNRVSNERGRYISIKATKADWVNPVDFQSYCYTAVGLFENKSLVEARQLLSKASSLIKEVLLIEDPHALQCLFSALLHLKSNGHPQIAASMRKYVSEMAKRILRRGHPWGQICQLFGVIDEDCLKPLFLQCWKRMVDGFEENLGRFHYDVIDNYLEYVENAYGSASPQTEITFREFMAECEEALGPSDPRVMRILLSLGWNLLEQKRYLEADEVGNDMNRRALHVAHDQFQVHGLEISAHAQYHTRRTFQAEGTLKQAINIAQRVYGKIDPWAVQLIFDLDSWLREWGRHDDAYKMKAEVEGCLEINDISI